MFFSFPLDLTTGIKYSSYFFIVLMLMLKFNIFGCQTTRERETVIFTVFVFFQIWNEINCRTHSPQRSCFKGLWDSKYFLNILPEKSISWAKDKALESFDCSTRCKRSEYRLRLPRRHLSGRVSDRAVSY